MGYHHTEEQLPGALSSFRYKNTRAHTIHSIKQKQSTALRLKTTFLRHQLKAACQYVVIFRLKESLGEYIEKVLRDVASEIVAG